MTSLRGSRGIEPHSWRAITALLTVSPEKDIYETYSSARSRMAAPERGVMPHASLDGPNWSAGQAENDEFADR